jgi:hypothetical protein
MTPRTTALCLAAAAAALLTGPPGQAAPAPAKACFFANQLSSWKEVGRDVVNLRVGVGDIYQLKLLGSCPDLPYAEAIGIETRGGSRHICSGLDVSLIVPASVTHTVPRRCMATSLRKLSPEEARALPRGQRP